MNEVEQTDPEWEAGYFYEFRIRIDGREAYVKALLCDVDPDPYLRVVSFHAGWRR